MIQRIQTLLLLAVAALLVATAFVPLLRVTACGDSKIDVVIKARGCVYSADLSTIKQTCETVQKPHVLYGVLFFLTAGAVVVLGALFSWKNRKKQMRLCNWVTLLICLLYPTLATYLYFMNREMVFTEFVSFCWGIFLPVVALLLNFWAFNRIKADERLVKSFDRIR
jgi:hypothetical protein